MMRRFLMLVAGLLVSACAGVAAPDKQAAPDWQLVSAKEIADARHIVMTVSRQDPAALAALAERFERDHPLVLVAEWPLASIDVHCFVFRIEEGVETEAALAALRQDARVRTVQRMNQFVVSTTPPDTDLTTLQPDPDLRNLRQVHAVATGKGARIGVVDTQPDAAHPELSGKVVLARDFVAARNAGRPGPEAHGTAVSGVIAAEARDGLGIVGVAPDASLLALRACWEPATGSGAGGKGVCSSFSLARALNFALGQDVHILNLSISGPEDPLLAELIEVARRKGIVMVAARGGAAEPGFPASAPGVLAVTTRGDPAGGAALRAPGLDVISTAPAGAYDFFSGSSIAAAYVSGVAALLVERGSDLQTVALREALLGGEGASADTVSACLAVNSTLPAAERLRCDLEEAVLQ
ncbi:MAG: S8 family serine peptidase [Pseudomonadota bacterium]